DPVIGLYNNSGALIQVVDDGVDSDSGMQTPDPAVVFRPNFTGSLRIVVASYPDLDLDGSGGASSGPYWLKIRRDFEGDGDGVLNAFDICPNDRENDIDKD